mmetsp:Transcript_90822/g.256526  ORF Transcript_90822/g.256526 Transcript_90822/m.256526 type:complete len:338 (+) Transcript_90822:83-1096(+)
MSGIPSEYETPEGMRTLANYLRSTNGVKVRHGIEHEKRVDYFKGQRLVECVLEGKKWPKSLPKITDKGVARLVAGLLVQGNFFHRSEKIPDKKGYLKISQKNVFEEKGYYTWMYAGNMMWSNILTGLVIAVVIGFTLLPIWPDVAKKVLWYCSVTFLIFTLSFCLIRFVLFLVLWLFGYEFWIFPRLFDESLSFQDSFKPIYSFEKGTPGQGFYRIGVLLTLIGFVYWACTQPTEFDGFIQAQKDFIDDLYSGNLLADVPADPATHMERMQKRVPSLEDLLKELENDDKEYIAEGVEGVVDENAAADNEPNYDEDKAEEDNYSDEVTENEPASSDEL